MQTETELIGKRARSALSKDFVGETVIPGEDGYDAARRVWNATADKYPAIVAFCESAADVSAAVRMAQKIGVPLSVRGGGHQVAGLSVCDDGVLIDLSRMNAVDAFADGSPTRAGGGCLLGQVDSANAKVGRITPAGVVSHTGLGGLALGGGVGWTFRNFGLTCDNIVGAEVVTANGDIVYAGEGGDTELLWALKGGGGNFGAVTEFELKTYPLVDVILGQAVFALEDLPRAIEHYVNVMAAAPDELTAICITCLAPPLPGVPKSMIGQPSVMINAVWSGEDLEAGYAPVRKLVEGAAPTVVTVERMPYIAVQTMQDHLHPHGRSNYNKSRYLDRVDADTIKAMYTAAEGLPGIHCQIEILRLGGAAARVAVDATAFAHRSAGYILNIVAAWTEVEQTDVSIAWARNVYSSMDAFGSEAGYINFIENEPDRANSVYPPATYARLQALKTRLDPNGVFSGNVPIEPLAS
jgi:FAD/FMN-containing dehydrogenase